MTYTAAQCHLLCQNRWNMKIFHFTELRIKKSQNYTHTTLCKKMSCDLESFFSGTILEQNNLMTQNIYQNMKVNRYSNQRNFACDGLYMYGWQLMGVFQTCPFYLPLLWSYSITEDRNYSNKSRRKNWYNVIHESPRHNIFGIRSNTSNMKFCVMFEHWHWILISEHAFLAFIEVYFWNAPVSL